MKSTRAEAFRGQLTSDGIALEFGGRAAAEQPQESGATIVLGERIQMPLLTAQRLAIALADALGPLPPAAFVDGPDRSGVTPRNAPPDAAGETGALLLRLVGELGVPCQHERSFRCAGGELLANRYLLSLNAADLGADARERVLGICDRLGMPAQLRDDAAADFAQAACVHFGFEAHQEGAMAKLYFERAITPDAARSAHARGESLLLHRAFKWMAAGQPGAAPVVTEYRWHPYLDAAAIGRRLEQLYGLDEPSLAIVREVAGLALGRVAADRLQYLEVEEENGRRSFDLNIYDAALRVADAQAQLDAMRERCGVRPGRFQALYDQIKMRPLGHVAGGVHRDGQQFFNVYYGVSGFPLFNQGFR